MNARGVQIESFSETRANLLLVVDVAQVSGLGVQDIGDTSIGADAVRGQYVVGGDLVAVAVGGTVDLVDTVPPLVVLPDLEVAVDEAVVQVKDRIAR